MNCGWPFHYNDGSCMECYEWETKYGENMDEYLRQLSEVRESAKATRRAERDAQRKITPRTESA